MNLFSKALFCYEEILNVLHTKNVPIEQKSSGDKINIYDLEITFYGLDSEQSKENTKKFEKICKTPEIDSIIQYDKNLNATSLAMYISKLNIFLTGDLVQGYEKFEIPQSDILKLTHHGQQDGMSEHLVLKTNPKAFIICADNGRKYGSACDEILNRCKEYFEKNNLDNNVYITGRLGNNANALLIENGTYKPFFMC